ncbi:hypothetical protein [Paraburkholderia flagellata]|uniref:hypothetical protein n=1 Tax=Paraburkholderia flagellata TaxID=2883241 RepID=UPI001F16BE83|nr:hypothetical protein [Paraburkholderia flagellata]
MLFKSLFDFETDNPAPSALPVPAAEPTPQPHPVPRPQAESIQADEARHDPDSLLAAIDALGEIVLALDAQLRAERRSGTQLRTCLNDELTALRTSLIH